MQTLLARNLNPNDTLTTAQGIIENICKTSIKTTLSYCESNLCPQTYNPYYTCTDCPNEHAQEIKQALEEGVIIVPSKNKDKDPRIELAFVAPNTITVTSVTPHRLTESHSVRINTLLGSIFIVHRDNNTALSPDKIVPDNITALMPPIWHTLCAEAEWNILTK